MPPLSNDRESAGQLSGAAARWAHLGMRVGEGAPEPHAARRTLDRILDTDRQLPRQLLLVWQAEAVAWGTWSQDDSDQVRFKAGH
jgi:hypothetical protein